MLYCFAVVVDWRKISNDCPLGFRGREHRIVAAEVDLLGHHRLRKIRTPESGVHRKVLYRITVLCIVIIVIANLDRMQSPIAENYQSALDSFRRRLIVDAARLVFERVGLEGASIRTIAQAAGCTTGAIYPHFQGKEEIYAAVLSE